MSTVRVERREGVALVALDRPPANAFDGELIESLRRSFRESADARAVLLGSALPSIFSAGWDLPAIVSRDRPGMERFLEAFCDLVREIFTFGPPVVAALPGHAIAGGLIVAAAADERYAARGKGQLGLSEVVLGVPIPRCCLEVFRHAIGARRTERLAATGENHSVEAAATIGLIDRIVEPEEVLDRALERARFLAGRPGQAHAAIKQRSRAAALARFDEARQDDPFLDFWFGADARERVSQLVAKLSKK
jgi:enoyl-CoA hydratase/carnithine racemase